MELTTHILARLKPIGGLSQRRLEELAALCQTKSYPLGSDPMQDSSGPEFAYLLAGELKIVLPDGSMRVLVGACDIANWPIGYKTVLPVSSKAITDVVLLRVDFETLDLMMTWDDMTAIADTEPTSEPAELPTGMLSAQVLTGNILSRLSPARIPELLNRLVRIKARSGQIIIREGEPGADYFLIESGRCEVHKTVGGVDLRVAELKSGDAFGEEALVSGAARNASIIMKTDGTLLRLSKPDFVELLQTPLLRAIDRPEAEQKIASGSARWLDVRYPAEFAENGLPGAINLPLNEIRSAIGLLDRQHEYIVYCQSGRRSSAGAFLLAQNGLEAYVLQGGLGLQEQA